MIHGIFGWHQESAAPRRIESLATHFAELIPNDCTVLDLGCGDGRVGLTLAHLRPDLKVRGADPHPRSECALPTLKMKNGRVKAEDGAFDVVLLSDVLHHHEQPLAILAEAARVSDRFVLIKDHLLEGFAAGPTLAAMDWVGNRGGGYPIPCDYWPEATWRIALDRMGFKIYHWRNTLNLYRWPLGLICDRSFHFVTLLHKPTDLNLEELTQIEWELAYLRFESPDAEKSKFRRRLQWAGADLWPRDCRVLELFCGRGSSLSVLHEMGFRHLKGVDLSPSLIQEDPQFRKWLIQADCRQLPFQDGSQDVVIIQGGLHHLESLKQDLPRVLKEVERVLSKNGKFVVVEPWKTPFLDFVHWVCRNTWLRLAWKPLAPLASMVRLEGKTYFSWLAQPKLVREELSKIFKREKLRVGWGKLCFVGFPEPGRSSNSQPNLRYSSNKPAK